MYIILSLTKIEAERKQLSTLNLLPTIFGGEQYNALKLEKNENNKRNGDSMIFENFLQIILGRPFPGNSIREKNQKLNIDAEFQKNSTYFKFQSAVRSKRDGFSNQGIKSNKT